MVFHGSCVLVICVIINSIILSYGSQTSFPSIITAPSRRAKTMANWVYFRVPRIEALIIKLRGRALHPGDMSCWKNLVTVTEFSSEFLIYFPTARKGSTYSVVIYSDIEVYFVQFGIAAETIFRGMKGPNSSVKNALLNFYGFKRIHVAVFEENPQRPISSLGLTNLKIGLGLHALDTIVSNTMGLAGKVCMALLADNYKITPKTRTINYEYQKHIEGVRNGW